MFKKTARWITLGLFAALVWASVVYFRDMNRAYRRISGKSAVIASRFGDIEYTEGGQGPAVLVIHGSGGGYDQGELVVQAVLGGQFHWIAPSRFGYLRSTFHPGATFDDQAHAYASLLDHLGVRKVALVALSHGGPSALLFAVLYPERVSSLTLISAGVAAVSTPDQAQANRKGEMLTTLFKYDPVYWGTTKLFKKRFMELMGANEAVVAGLTPGQRVLAEQLIDYMNPVSQRSEGVVFDHNAAMPNERIAAVRAPTLIFHSTDDTLQLYDNAAFAASTIPEARLMRFGRGGHLLLSVEQPTIKAALQKHILDSLNGTQP